MNSTPNYNFKRLIQHIWDVLCMKTGKRISVGEYLLAAGLINVAFAILSLLVALILPNAIILSYILLVLSCAVGIPYILKRLSDLGRKWTHIFFILIPLYNIYRALYVAFKKGTVGANTYGTDPLIHQPKSNGLYRVFWLVCFGLVIGITLITPTPEFTGSLPSSECLQKLQSGDYTGALAACDTQIQDLSPAEVSSGE